MKKFELIQFGDPDELAKAVAKAWSAELCRAAKAGQTYRVALSGGRIARKLFAAVLALPPGEKAVFQSAEFFWADERCVPPADPESNFGIAQAEFFRPMNIASERIHRIHGELPPDVAAAAATAEIQRGTTLSREGQPIFDLIFLGLGEDGHVASLFPGEAEVERTNSAVYRAIRNSPKPPPQRVTLGYPTLAAARQVWVLASGPGKAAALQESLKPARQTPLGRVIEMRAATRILSDFAPT